MTSNERIRLDLILNRSCVAVVIDTLGHPSETFFNTLLGHFADTSGDALKVRV